jgi:hypothetical protein
MTTLLVTGGAGFIGANFVIRQRIKASATIVNLDKLTYAGNLETLSSVMSLSRAIFAIAPSPKLCCNSTSPTPLLTLLLRPTLIGPLMDLIHLLKPISWAPLNY